MVSIKPSAGKSWTKLPSSWETLQETSTSTTSPRVPLLPSNRLVAPELQVKGLFCSLLNVSQKQLEPDLWLFSPSRHQRQTGRTALRPAVDITSGGEADARPAQRVALPLHGLNLPLQSYSCTLSCSSNHSPVSNYSTVPQQTIQLTVAINPFPPLRLLRWWDSAISFQAKPHFRPCQGKSSFLWVIDLIGPSTRSICEMLSFFSQWTWCLATTKKDGSYDVMVWYLYSSVWILISYFH